MTEASNITYQHPYGFHGEGATHSVYLLDAKKFCRIWQNKGGERADPSTLKRGDIEELKQAIANGEELIMRLPHIELYGNGEIDVIDGRHRLNAYAELGLPIPVLVKTDLHADLARNYLYLGLISPLPEEMKKQISGESEGENQSVFAQWEREIKEAIKRWARENEEKLRKQFAAKYGAFVCNKCFDHYAENGVMPANF